MMAEAVDLMVAETIAEASSVIDGYSFCGM